MKKKYNYKIETDIIEQIITSNFIEPFIIPINITKIGKYAFYNKTFKEVHINKNITNIGAYAFANSAFLERIVFEGTIEEWNRITFGNSWNYNIPATFVQCIDGNVNI